MTTLQIETLAIHGYLVGPIWWPIGAECWKHLCYDILREDSRFTEPGTLRDHVLRATNDGDFQGADIADGQLEVTTAKRVGDTVVRRTRFFPLSMFPSIRDCLKEDWAGPVHFDDED